MTRARVYENTTFYWLEKKVATVKVLGVHATLDYNTGVDSKEVFKSCKIRRIHTLKSAVKLACFESTPQRLFEVIR